MSQAAQTTAFVFAGGGSLGAVQVGMLRELMDAGVSADLVLGSSVGAMNAAYFAGAPHAAGVNKLEEVWRGLRRHDVFPVTFRSVLGFMGGADNLIDPSLPRTLAAPPYVCHPAPRSRRSWPVLRFLQRSRRFASANIIFLMARSGATRRFSMQPIWVPTALSFSRRDLLALSTSRQRERSRGLCMRSRCLSPIRWCAISGSLAEKLMFLPYPICARLMSLLTISLVPTN
jgi:Patatin-like phospholipase